MFKNNIKYLKMFEKVGNGERSVFWVQIEKHSEQLLETSTSIILVKLN